MQINIEYDYIDMTQQIMFRDWKYLHVELIGLRVCSPAVIAAFSNHVEIAPSSQPAAARLFMTLPLQKYKRDYTERYSESISSANETTKNCIRQGAIEGKSMTLAMYSVQRARNTVCGMDYTSAKSNKLISLE